MPSKTNDFGQGGLLAFWNSLTIDERETIVKNLEDFHALITSLKNRGIIEIDRLMTELVVNKRCPEVDELIALRDKVNAKGMRVIYKEPEPPKKKPRIKRNIAS